MNPYRELIINVAKHLKGTAVEALKKDRKLQAYGFRIVLLAKDELGVDSEPLYFQDTEEKEIVFEDFWKRSLTEYNAVGAVFITEGWFKKFDKDDVVLGRDVLENENDNLDCVTVEAYGRDLNEKWIIPFTVENDDIVIMDEISTMSTISGRKIASHSPVLYDA